MANTTNFGWETPDDTDLVKDGALAIRTLGSAIDTSLVDLKGGTTGQILAKNSNTDMDFVWIANDQGDITEVVAGTGLSGGGTSGSVTLTNTVATAYDAKGDLIVGTGADTFSKLTAGTNGHVLTADSSTATGLKWAAAAGGGKVLQVVSATYSTATTVASTTYADTGLSATITPSSTSSKILVFVSQKVSSVRTSILNGTGLKLQRNGSDIHNPDPGGYESSYLSVGASSSVELFATVPIVYLDSPSSTSALTYKTQGRTTNTVNSGSSTFQFNSSISTITLMEIAG